MSAQVSSTVGAASPPVPATMIPSSRAASMSIAAFARPVVTSSFSAGSRSRRARGNGVRSRIATTISNGARRSISASSSATWSVNTVGAMSAASSSHGPSASATAW